LPLCAAAQSLEPRAYSAPPVGLNFRPRWPTRIRKGGVAFDPSIPLENGDARVDALALGYVRTLGVLGKSGSVRGSCFPLPASTAARRSTAPREQRKISGMGDPALRLAVNFHGAPAMTRAQFAQYRQT